MTKVTIKTAEQLVEALEGARTISAVEAILADSSVRALRSYAKAEGFYFCKPLPKVTKDELVSAILGSFDGVFETEESEIEAVVEAVEVVDMQMETGFSAYRKMGVKFLDSKMSKQEINEQIKNWDRQPEYWGCAHGLAVAFDLEIQGKSYTKLMKDIEDFISNYSTEPEVSGPEFKDFPSEYTKESEKQAIINHNFIEVVHECKTEAELKAFFMKCKNVETLQEMARSHYGRLPAIIGASVKIWAEWFTKELWPDLTEMKLRREDEIREEAEAVM